jgi:hypothetical protein
VKLNETNPERTSRRATVEDVKEKVNNILKSHQDPKLQKTQIIAVKQHPSGDLTLFTSDQQSTEQLIAQREQWQQTLGEKAAVKVLSFGILVHGVSTQVEAHNRTEIEEKIPMEQPVPGESEGGLLRLARTQPGREASLHHGTGV